MIIAEVRTYDWCNRGDFMDLNEKLQILTDAAKYDVSCSSSGSTRKNNRSGLGNGAISGICHSWSEDGRCISLLKILLTNHCIYNCEYCINRRSNDIKRASFTPREVADLTLNFYKRNYIEGLFLSSGVIRNPDYTMALLIETARILRTEMNFNGYIHMKAIPGAAKELVDRIGLLVDRLSINIELPTEQSLALLAPQKNFQAILDPMAEVKAGLLANREDRKKFRSAPKFVPAGQTTQMIIGASRETDKDILYRSQSLYKDFSLKRVYYSAFVPVVASQYTQGIDRAPLAREHRIYQADWLLRFYGFKAEDLLDDKNKNLDLSIDPKANWALHHLDQFPIEINTAPYADLLKIPGIGKVSAHKIIKARNFRRLSFEDLKAMRISTKKAGYFITVGGKYRGGHFSPDQLRTILSDGWGAQPPEQLSLWSHL